MLNKVSVIMNCYNSETFLAEAIQSVINQTYQNWELIFWDNNSSDRSAKIVKSFNDSRIKYFFSDKHMKLYESRNLAINKCNGRYITFLDCDDVWNNEKLKIQVEKISGDNEVVYGNYNSIDETGRIIKNQFKELPSGNITNKLFNNNFISIGTIMIPRSLLIKNLFNPDYNLLGDLELWIRLSTQVRFISLINVLESSRVHERNTSKLLYKDWYKEKKMFYLDFLMNQNYIKYNAIFIYILKAELRNIIENFINFFRLKK